ncbi:hypothetical protein [Nonomuraea insulae]|uniref:Uncharacterized protein n=1 Tax=Nonomuraea insulae TaxID=1616787 RepID=A0ABW1CF38_9ACTN
MLQKAQIDYTTSPGPINDAIVRIAKEIPGGPPVTASGNADAVGVVKRLKLIGNGPNQTLGDFDVSRVEQTVEILRPIFTARGLEIPAGLKAGDLVTNEFTDPSPGLPQTTG